MHSFHLGSSPGTTRGFERRPGKTGSRDQVVFFDAEGTLWVPRPGRTMKEFWDNPSPRHAKNVFEPAEGVHEALTALRARHCRLVVLSRHDERLLPGLLKGFGLDVFFEDVIVNGDKGDRAVEWLETHRIPRSAALMVGDREDLDITPMRRVGIQAVLVDRPYNRHVDAPRLSGWDDLLDASIRMPSAGSADTRPLSGPARNESKRI